MSTEKDDDKIFVNINRDWEMEWWPWRLGVSRRELIRAVNRVGPALDRIKKYFSQKH